MTAWYGPYVGGAALLALAGAPKLWRPESMRRALAEMGLPAPTWGVRAFGAIEALIFVAALVIGGWIPAALTAASYAAFAVFVAAGVRRDNLTSCGCFAGDDAPPSALHVVVDLGFAAVALGAALTHPPTIWRAFSALGAGGGVLLVGFAVVDVALAYVVLTRLPLSPRPAGVKVRLAGHDEGGDVEAAA